ncbi:hypothetical protein BKA70DRAFT_1263295 [Coprinopsis sp. MPI-PUGE-AT-0042]|nr:hypothetical protein BKA70DRAFT_1263295 [Coprinopsis sp. MPI-PUGE-AT-0042]
MLHKIKHRIARTTQKPPPPLQALPIPLDVFCLIIDTHFTRDRGTLKALSLACRPLLAHCRSILFSCMDVGGWHDAKLTHSFASEFSPCNILDLVIDLQITFRSFSILSASISFFFPSSLTLTHTLGFDRYHRLVTPWIRFLTRSTFPRLKTLRIRFQHGGLLPANLQRVLVRMMERAPNLRALDFKTSEAPFILPILLSGARFAAIEHLRVSAVAWSAFCRGNLALQKQTFPLLKALDILGLPEEPPSHHPSSNIVGSSTLHHLEFTNLNSRESPSSFGPAHNFILKAHSETLRCLHIDIQWLTMENLDQRRSEAYYPIALHNLPSLEYFEISLSSNPNILPTMFTWISNLFGKIPLPSISEVQRRLRIAILLHGEDLFPECEDLGPFAEWAGEGIIDYSICGDRWPSLRMVKLSVYFCTTSDHYSRGRFCGTYPSPSWCHCRTACSTRLNGPFTVGENTGFNPSSMIHYRWQLSCTVAASRL